MTNSMRAWGSRLTAGLALGVVASVTGVISYTHVYDLTVSLHQSMMVARLMPFGVDGLIVVGSVVLLQSAPGQAWLGWLGIVPGVAASLFANVKSGLRWGPLTAGWAGVPAASFALATFLLERWLKAQAGHGGQGGTELLRAAEGMNRAARAPWSRSPAASPPGAMLRTAAYLLAGCAPVRQRTAARHALIIALVGLAHAVARLRRPAAQAPGRCCPQRRRAPRGCRWPHLGHRPGGLPCWCHVPAIHRPSRPGGIPTGAPR
jgi:hypothetical protein